MKILILSHRFYPNIGGIETLSDILADNFFKAGHNVHLLTWSTDPSNKKFPYQVARKPTITRLIKEHAWADIVFENNPCLRLAWPNIFFGRPSVIGLHTWIPKLDGKVTWAECLKFRWLKRAQRVISCSEAMRKICWPSSIVIGNPYQEDTFKILPNITKTADFIFFGRLVSDKGADLAIQAFHSLLQAKAQTEFSSLKLTVVGDGPELEHLQQLTIELNLEKSVVFTGALRGEKLVECLNQHRFLLVPSVWEEPFGIVALEGMACGCVPIVSDGGGLPDAIGAAGLTFRRGNVTSLLESMFKILENPDLEKELHIKAVSHLAAHRSATVSRQYISIIENLHNYR